MNFSTNTPSKNILYAISINKVVFANNVLHATVVALIKHFVPFNSLDALQQLSRVYFYVRAIFQCDRHCNGAAQSDAKNNIQNPSNDLFPYTRIFRKKKYSLQIYIVNFQKKMYIYTHLYKPG